MSDLELVKKGMSTLTLKKLSVALFVTSDYILFGRTDDNFSHSDSIITEMLKTLSPDYKKAFSMFQPPHSPNLGG